MIEQWVQWLLSALSLPQVGLMSVFVVSLLSATLLPLPSEPAVVGYLFIRPDMLWPTVLVATAGNVLGGLVDYWMGLGAHALVKDRSKAQLKALDWLERFGPKALFFSFLPIVGDPLCAVAGWVKLPFWPSLFWMTLGKFLRYAIYTVALIQFFPEAIKPPL